MNAPDIKKGEKMDNETHDYLLELKRRIFNNWIKTPADIALSAQLDLLDEIIFKKRRKMDDEKKELIELLVKDFKENEGKGTNNITVRELYGRLERFTVEELKTILGK